MNSPPSALNLLMAFSAAFLGGVVATMTLKHYTQHVRRQAVRIVPLNSP